MATRRRLPLMGYGQGDMPAPRSGMTAALPPPPDGTIPNRLPVGMDPPAAEGAPVMPQQMQWEGSGDDTNADPLRVMLRLLEQANGLR